MNVYKYKTDEIKRLLGTKEVWITHTLYTDPMEIQNAHFSKLIIKPLYEDPNELKTPLSLKSGKLTSTFQTEGFVVKDTWENFYKAEIERLKAKGIKAEFQYNSKKQVRIIRRLTKNEIKEALKLLDMPKISQSEQNYVRMYLPVRIKTVNEDSNRIEKGEK